MTAAGASPSRHQTDMADWCLHFADLFDIVISQSSSSSSSSAAAAGTTQNLASDQHNLKLPSYKFLLDDELFDRHEDAVSNSQDVDYSIHFALEAIKSHS